MAAVPRLGRDDMTWVRLAILTVFMLAVAGCGGDSAQLRPEAPDRQAQIPVEAEVGPAEVIESTELQNDMENDKELEEDTLAEERQLVEDAILEAEAEAAPGQFGDESAVQEARLSAAADFAPYVPTSGHAEFDGSDVRVHLPIYVGGYRAVLSSVPDEVDGIAASSRLAGYSRRTWTLSGNGPLAVVSVRWNDDDSSDYLAAGWWVRDTFGRNALETGAFVDGPELRGPLPDSMSLPLSGQATYHGEASGVYQVQTRVHCTSFPCGIPSVDQSVGEFAADAKLVANFTRGDIEGCVGCEQGIRFAPAAYDLDSGEIERDSAVSRDYLFWLHRAGFLQSPHSKGTFSGDLTVVPLGGHAAGYGFWRGRFSNLSDSDGSPRLLGATLNGQFEDESTATQFTGVLSAESDTFGGSP